MDTETTPATGSRVAERMITRNEAAFLIGGLHSGVANAISQVAQKYGCIYFNTNSVLADRGRQGLPPHQVRLGRQRHELRARDRQERDPHQRQNWVLLTNDYVWGHQTSKATRALAEANGAKIVDELMIPQNTRDFSAYLLKLQQIKPEVVAAAVGGDDIKALRQQVVQLGLQKRMAWINNQQDWPDVYGLGPDQIFGVFGTTWYYRLDLPGVKEFVAAYQKQYPGHGDPRAGQRLPNGYMATRELLRCVEEAGTTANIAVIKKLEGRKMTRARPHAAPRRVDRPGHAPVPADDLHGERTTTRRPRRTTSSRSWRRSSRRTSRTRTRRRPASSSRTTRRRRTSSETDPECRHVPDAWGSDALTRPPPASRQRPRARPAVRADRARVHAGREPDGDDQPRARLVLRAGDVRRAADRRAARRPGVAAARRVEGASGRRALCDRARARADRRRRVRRRCSSSRCAAPTAAIRCTGCC